MIMTILGVLLLIIIAAIINAVALLIGVLIVKIPKPKFQQIYTCSIVFAILCLLVSRMIYVSYDRGVLLRTIALVAGFAAVAIVPPVLLRYQFRTSWAKTAGLSFLWLVGSAGIAVLGMVLTVISAQRAYVVPTNGMAPTLNGLHRVGTCEHCGGSVVISAPADAPADENVEGICSSCWRYGQAREIQSAIVAGDRFFAGPFLKPKRWDIVTFHPPEAPGVLYVQRIVGLPGESVLIKDGRLWINGTVQLPPPGLDNLVYAGSEEMSATHGFDSGLFYGLDDKPCSLAADECFVLGDNTFRSSDSRFFGPVKMEQLTGVVTMRYWPPSRATTLRW